MPETEEDIEDIQTKKKKSSQECQISGSESVILGV